MNNRENFFSQYGTLAHKTLEKYNKGELEIFELKDYFSDNYNNYITESPPPNKYIDINDVYYEKGEMFFEKFQGNKDETISAEEPFSFYLTCDGKKRKIIGYIDRVSRDKNGIIVTDYKSKSKFKNKKELDEYARQLYIYAIAVKKKYGEYPYKLVFFQFKENKKIVLDFDIKKLNECKRWIRNTIRLIYKEMLFPKNENFFFCNYLCNIGLDYCEFDKLQ